jgi:adhesin transport system outer membrane protein
MCLNATNINSTDLYLTTAGMAQRCSYALLISLALSFSPAAKAEVSLAEAVTQAMQRDHRVAAAFAEIAAAKNEVSVAEGGYYPSLQANVGSADNFAGNTYEIRATQMLYDWGKVDSRVGKQNAVVDKQAEQLHKAQMDVALDAITAYLNVQAATQQIDLTHDYLEQLRALNAQAVDRRDSGYSGNAEAQRTQVDIAKAKESLARQYGEEASASAELDELTGYTARDVSPTTSKNSELNRYLQRDSRSISALIKQAPEYQSALADIEIARSDLALKKAERWPDVNLEASWGRQDFGAGAQQDSSIGIQLRYDAFQGLSSLRKPESARQRLESAEYGAQAVFRDLQRAIRKLSTLEPAIAARSEALHLQAQNARQIKVGYLDQFNAGLRDLEDLLAIERDIFEAERQAIDLNIQLSKDRYTLAAQLGVLSQLFK